MPGSIPAFLGFPAVTQPAILGTWQAGRVLAVDRNTHRMHVDHSPINPDLSDSSLMPYGQRIRLGSGYDKASDVAYWLIEWLVPYPTNSCQYPFLQFHCTESNGVSRPDQRTKSLEFTMDIKPADSDIDSFFPVGATKSERVYYLRCGNNGEWEPEFYVSKDRQRLWSSVALPDHQNYYGLQEYHRVAAYKRP